MAVHFETILSYSILRQRILTSSALTSSRLDDFSDIVAFILGCNDNSIWGELGGFFFVFRGGGVGSF